MYECLVYHADAAGGGVVTCEIPVARMIRARLMESFDALENQLYRRIHSFWSQHFHDLAVYLIDGEGCIYSAHMVVRCRVGLTQGVGVGNDLLLAALLNESYRCTEGAQLLKVRHVDAVVVGIAYLG